MNEKDHPLYLVRLKLCEVLNDLEEPSIGDARVEIIYKEVQAAYNQVVDLTRGGK